MNETSLGFVAEFTNLVTKELFNQQLALSLKHLTHFDLTDNDIQVAGNDAEIQKSLKMSIKMLLYATTVEQIARAKKMEIIRQPNKNYVFPMVYRALMESATVYFRIYIDKSFGSNRKTASEKFRDLFVPELQDNIFYWCDENCRKTRNICISDDLVGIGSRDVQYMAIISESGIPLFDALVPSSEWCSSMLSMGCYAMRQQKTGTTTAVSIHTTFNGFATDTLLPPENQDLGVFTAGDVILGTRSPISHARISLFCLLKERSEFGKVISYLLQQDYFNNFDSAIAREIISSFRQQIALAFRSIARKCIFKFEAPLRHIIESQFKSKRDVFNEFAHNYTECDLPNFLDDNQNPITFYDIFARIYTSAEQWTGKEWCLIKKHPNWVTPVSYPAFWTTQRDPENQKDLIR